MCVCLSRIIVATIDIAFGTLQGVVPFFWFINGMFIICVLRYHLGELDVKQDQQQQQQFVSCVFCIPLASHWGDFPVRNSGRFKDEQWSINRPLKVG